MFFNMILANLLIFQGFPGLAVYSGTKFFIEGMSSSMRKELADTGVRITCIQPGDVASEISNFDTDKEVGTIIIVVIY